jgi:hypothetical protein
VPRRRAIPTAPDRLEPRLDAQRQQQERHAIVQLPYRPARIAERFEVGERRVPQTGGNLGFVAGSAGGVNEPAIVLAGGADVGGARPPPGRVGSAGGFHEAGAEILEFAHGAPQPVSVLRSSAEWTATITGAW